MKHAIFLFLITLAFSVGSSAAQDSRSVAGEWDAAFNTPGGPRSFKLVIAVDGEKISGTAKRANGDVPVAGTIKGDEIAFSYTVSYNGHDLTLSFAGKVKGDTMGGVVSFGGQAEEGWTAHRAPVDKPKAD